MNKIQVTVTEHTTTDDTFCTIEADGFPAGEFFGSADEFEADLDTTRFAIAEVVWS